MLFYLQALNSIFRLLVMLIHSRPSMEKIKELGISPQTEVAKKNR